MNTLKNAGIITLSLIAWIAAIAIIFAISVKIFGHPAP